MDADEEFRKQQQRLLNLQQQAQSNVLNRRRTQKQAQSVQPDEHLDEQRRRILLSKTSAPTEQQRQEREKQHTRLLKAQLNIYASTGAANLVARGPRRALRKPKSSRASTVLLHRELQHEQHQSEESESEFSEGVHDELLDASSSDADSEPGTEETRHQVTRGHARRTKNTVIRDSYESPLSRKQAIFLSICTILILFLTHEPFAVPVFVLPAVIATLYAGFVAVLGAFIRLGDSNGHSEAIWLIDAQELHEWLDVRNKDEAVFDSIMQTVRDLSQNWTRDIHQSAMRIGVGPSAGIASAIAGLALLNFRIAGALVLVLLLTGPFVPWNSYWTRLEEYDVERKMQNALQVAKEQSHRRATANT